MARHTSITEITGTPPRDAAGMYAIELHQRIAEILTARYRDPYLAEEVASRETLTFLRRSTEIMEQYRTPARYARARVDHGTSDFFTSERVQRSEGARLVHGKDGTIRTGRAVVSGDRIDPETGTTLWETHTERDPIDPYTPVVARDTYEHVTSILSPDLRQIVDGVVRDGFTVTDVAADLSIARETAQRKLRRALDTMQAEVERCDTAA